MNKTTETFEIHARLLVSANLDDVTDKPSIHALRELFNKMFDKLVNNLNDTGENQLAVSAALEQNAILMGAMSAMPSNYTPVAEGLGQDVAKQIVLATPVSDMLHDKLDNAIAQYTLDQLTTTAEAQDDTN